MQTVLFRPSGPHQCSAVAEMSKRKETSPKVEGFLQYLKSIYDIESNAETTFPKKWEGLISFGHIVLVSLRSPVHFVCFWPWYICSKATGT